MLLAFLLFIVSSILTNQLHAQAFDDYKAYATGSGSITSVKFSRNGDIFAAGNINGLVIMRNSNTNEILYILRGLSQEVSHLDFSPNGKYVVGTAIDGQIIVWDIATQKEVWKNKSTADFYEFAYFSNDSQTLIYGGGSTKKVLEVRFSNPSANVSTLYVDDQAIAAADYSRNGNQLLLASKGTAKVFDFATKKTILSINACGGKIVDLQYNTDNSQIACLCDDGTFKTFEVNTQKSVLSKKIMDPGFATQLSFSPDGSYVAIGDTKQTPKVYDATTLQVLSDLHGHQKAIRCVDFAPNSKLILTGGNDSQVHMWKYRQIIEQAEVPVPTPEPAPPPATKPSPPPTRQPAAPKSEASPKPALPDIPLKKKTATPAPIVPKAVVVELEEEPPYTPPANFKLINERLKFNNKDLPDTLVDRKITPGRVKFLYSNEITIKVWDSEYEDGDTISLYLNGQWILQEYALRNKKKTIKITLDPNGDNYFVLHAHNEGTRPTNTAAIAIYDGKLEHKIALSSDKRRSDMINLKVSPSAVLGNAPPK